MPVALRTIPVLTIGSMAFDLLMPVRLAASVHHAISLPLTFPPPRDRDPIYLFIIATVRIWTGLFPKPSGIPVP